MSSLQIISASTSGHTDFVIATLLDFLKKKQPALTTNVIRAEVANSDDFLKGDTLLLACGTWNTGSAEGQLSPQMYALLLERVKKIDLGAKPVAVIALGDKRYYYTARAADHLESFVTSHNGTLLPPTLRIINEPYGQEEKIREWGTQFIAHLS